MPYLFDDPTADPEVLDFEAGKLVKQAKYFSRVPKDETLIPKFQETLDDIKKKLRDYDTNIKARGRTPLQSNAKNEHATRLDKFNQELPGLSQLLSDTGFDGEMAKRGYKDDFDKQAEATGDAETLRDGVRRKLFTRGLTGRDDEAAEIWVAKNILEDPKAVGMNYLDGVKKWTGAKMVSRERVEKARLGAEEAFFQGLSGKDLVGAASFHKAVGTEAHAAFWKTSEHLRSTFGEEAPQIMRLILPFIQKEKSEAMRGLFQENKNEDIEVDTDTITKLYQDGGRDKFLQLMAMVSRRESEEVEGVLTRFTKSANRGLLSIGSSLDRAELARNISRSEELLSGDEDVYLSKFASDNKSAIIANEIKGLSRVKKGKPLTESQKKEMRGHLDYWKARQQFTRDVKDIKSIVSTIPTETIPEKLAYFTATSIPYMTIVSHPMGVASVFNATREDHFEEILQANPNVNQETARNAAATSAAIYAATERLKFLTFMGRVPGLNKAVKPLSGGKFAKTLGLTVGAEYTQETIQEATLPIVMDAWAKVKESFPEGDWDHFKILDADRFFAVLPLSTLSAGGQRAREMINASELSALLSDTKSLQISGATLEEAGTIVETAKLEPDKALSMWRELMAGKTQEERDTVGRAAMQESIDEMVESGVDPGVEALPMVRSDGEGGFVVDYADGRASDTAATQEEAQEYVTEWQQEQDVTNLESVKETIKRLEERAEGDNIVDHTPNKIMTMSDLVKSGVERESDILKAIAVYHLQRGETVPENIDLTKYQESGSVRLRNKIAGYAVKIAKGATPVTVIEEFSEGMLQLLVQEGETDFDLVKGLLDEFSELSGIPLVEGYDVDPERAVIEGFSKFTKGYFLQERDSDAVDDKTKAWVRKAWRAFTSPESFSPKFRPYVRLITDLLKHVFEVASAISDMREKGGGLNPDLELLAQRAIGVDEASYNAKKEKEYREELLEEMLDPSEELSEQIKGKLPRPDDVGNDPLRGELHGIWDSFKRESRRRKKDGKRVIISGKAANFFAPKGQGMALETLRQAMNEEGFEFETPADMLDAVLDSVEGRKVWPVGSGEQSGGRSFSIGNTDVTTNAETRTFPTKDGVVVGPATFSITAFHGTPHKVDKFTTAKMGEGEGAQAFGWGLYFAQLKSVAQDYFDKFNKRFEDGLFAGDQEIEFSNPDYSLLYDIMYEGAEGVIRRDNELIASLKKAGAKDSNSVIEKARERIEQVPQLVEQYGGEDNLDLRKLKTANLYTVTLKAEENELLDWDKPLSKQSEKVRDAILPLLDEHIINNDAIVRDDFKESALDGSMAAAKAYLTIGGEMNIKNGLPSAEAGSKALSKVGIKGIRYLDGNSRSDGEGSYNYVIFNDADIEIKEENGKPVDTGASFSITETPLLKDGFYSQLERVLAKKVQGKAATPQQLKALLDPSKGSGIKAEEIKWSGIIPKIDDLARDNNGKVPMQELKEWLETDGRVKFEEIDSSDKWLLEDENNRPWMVSDSNSTEYFDTEEEANAAKEEWIDNLIQQGTEREIVNVGEDFTLEDDGGDGGVWTVLNNIGLTVQGFDTKEEAEEHIEFLKTQYTIEPLYEDNWERDTGNFYDTEEEAQAARDTEDRDEYEFEVTVERNEDYSSDSHQYAEHQMPGGENYREIVLAMPGKEETYTSTHFQDVPNYVAHMRINEREGGLFIEEIQSDRHQEGRKKGYKGEKAERNLEDLSLEELRSILTYNDRNGAWDDGDRAAEGLDPLTKEDALGVIANWQDDDPAMDLAEFLIDRTNTNGIADAPYRKDWPLAMFKRALRDAVESGKEWIGWTVGETQNDRYDLRKTVDKVILFPDMTIRAYQDGAELISEKTTEDKLPELIGKEASQKLLDAPLVKEAPNENSEAESHRKIEGDDLKVGGSGMKGFYDKILPSAVQKYIKQWGGKVEKAGIAQELDYKEWRDSKRLPATRETLDQYELERKSEFQTPIWKVPITEKMRDSVKAGQASFSITRAQDADYLAAVEAGDMEAAQEMVDEAAKAAGYEYNHRQNKSDIPDSGDVLLFAEDGEINSSYGEYQFTVKGLDPVPGWVVDFSKEYYGDNQVEPQDIIESAQAWDDRYFVSEFWQRFEGRLIDEEIVGFSTPDGAVVFDSFSALANNQIKSADPVTYDESGEVIPLSQRFNEQDDRITFSITPVERSTAIADALDRLFTGPVGMVETGKNLKKKLASVRDRYEAKIHGTPNANPNVDADEREMATMNALMQLNAIASVLPREIRHVVGSPIPLVSLKSAEAKERNIIKRLDKISVALETVIKTEYRGKIKKLIDKSTSQFDKQTRRKKSKIGDVGHQIADAAVEAMVIGPVEASTKADAIRAEYEMLEEPTLAKMEEAEGRALAFELFADYDNADSGRLERAIEFLQLNYGEGRKEWLSKLKDRKDLKDSRVAQIRQAIGATDFTGFPEITKSNKKNSRLRSGWSQVGQELNSFYQMMDFMAEKTDDPALRATIKNASDSFRRARNSFGDNLEMRQEEVIGQIGEILGVTGGINKAARVNAELVRLSKPSSVNVTYLVGRDTEEVSVPVDMVDVILRKEVDMIDGDIFSEEDLSALKKADEEFQELPYEVRNRRGVVRFTRHKSKGKRVPLGELSQLDLAKEWLALQQQDAKKKYEKGGWDETTLLEIESELLPETRAIAKFLQEYLREMTGGVDELHREEYGLALASIENYFPLLFNVVGNETEISMDGNNISVSARKGSWLKGRVSHAAMPKQANALAVMQGHLASVEFWKTHIAVLREWGGVLRDQKMQHAMQAKMGIPFTKNINNWIKMIESNGRDQALINLVTDQWVRKVQGGMSLAVLGARLRTVAVNATAGLNVLFHVPITKLLRGLQTDTFGDVVDLVKSPTFQRRLKSGGSYEATIALEQRMGGGLVGTTLLRAAQLGMQPINFADTLTNLSTVLAYRAQVVENRKEGMSEEAAKAHALDYVDDIMTRVAQPTDMLSRSLFENKIKGGIGGLLFLFASEARKNTAIMGLAARKIATGKGIQNRSMAAQQLLVGTLLYSTLGYVLKSIVEAMVKNEEDDEEDFEGRLISRLTDEKAIAHAMATEHLRGMPLLGELWSAISAKAINSIPLLEGERVMTYDSSNNPLMRAVRGINSAGKTIDSENADELTDNLIDSIQGLAGVLPQTAVFAQGANLAEDSLGFYRNISGKQLSEDETLKRIISKIIKKKEEIYEQDREEFKTASSRRKSQITDKRSEDLLELLNLKLSEMNPERAHKVLDLLSGKVREDVLQSAVRQ